MAGARSGRTRHAVAATASCTTFAPQHRATKASAARGGKSPVMDRRVAAGILLAALLILAIAFWRSNESAKTRTLASSSASNSDPVASGFAPVVVPLPTIAAQDDAALSAYATFAWGT